MKILEINEIIKISGGQCKYDYQTEKALLALDSAAAAGGYSGLPYHQELAAQIIFRSKYVKCD